MSYSSLRAALLDLERTGQLLRINTPLSPDLEMAEVHRRIFDANGPALWFQNVVGSPFTAASILSLFAPAPAYAETENASAPPSRKYLKPP